MSADDDDETDELLAELARCARWIAAGEAARRKRDALLMEGRRSGFLLRELGEAANLTHAGVIRILRREATRDI